MKIVNASYEIINKDKINGMDILKEIERVGRTCYKSEDNVTDISASKFVETLIKHGHEAMIEHNAIGVKFICDRGVSHELVRHRLASFGQESTRYCNYSKDKFGKEITVIKPYFWDENSYVYAIWKNACEKSEVQYFELLNNGATPQEARSILTTSLKTEIFMTMNIRSWRHFFKLRCDITAHPQMRELTIPLLKEMSELIPVVFDDLRDKFITE